MTTATEAVPRTNPPLPAFQKGLLVTGTAPGEPGVGGVILKDLIQHSDVSRWHCCWLASKQGRQDPYWNELATTVRQRRYETAYRPVPGLLGEAISAVALRVLRPGMINSLTAALRRLSQETQPDFVLAVLDCPAVIESALQLQRETSIPLRCIVWDDVELLCRQGQLDRWSRARVERAFGKVLQLSERVAVICENMQAEYRRRYGIESSILRHGVPTLANSSCARPSEDVFRIGFAGSLTAPDCMRAFMEGLDAVQWKINGREVVLRILGARMLLDSRVPQRMEYFGWRSVEETCQRLSECDLLYLPQSFTDENRTFSELSFPTKLSTYVSARRPILLHAPAYASLSGFWQQHAMGPRCGRCDSRDLRDTVTNALLADNEQQQAWIAEIARVHADTLGTRQFELGVEALIAPRQ